jgi:hypothetical protein
MVGNLVPPFIGRAQRALSPENEKTAAGEAGGGSKGQADAAGARQSVP